MLGGCRVGDQWRRVSSAVTGPRVPNLSPVRHYATCNANSLALSKSMHPMDCGGCPVNEKPVKFGDEFLETLVEAA